MYQHSKRYYTVYYYDVQSIVKLFNLPQAIGLQQSDTVYDDLSK